MSEARNRLAEAIELARSAEPAYVTRRGHRVAVLVDAASSTLLSSRPKTPLTEPLLADDPRPPGSTKPTREDDTYRVRVGAYRIVYEVFDDRFVIHVVRIGHRRDIYKE